MKIQQHPPATHPATRRVKRIEIAKFLWSTIKPIQSFWHQNSARARAFFACAVNSWQIRLWDSWPNLTNGWIMMGDEVSIIHSYTLQSSAYNPQWSAMFFQELVVYRCFGLLGIHSQKNAGSNVNHSRAVPHLYFSHVYLLHPELELSVAYHTHRQSGDVLQSNAQKTRGLIRCCSSARLAGRILSVFKTSLCRCFYRPLRAFNLAGMITYE